MKLDTAAVIFDSVKDSCCYMGLVAEFEEFFGERFTLRLDRKMKNGQTWDGGSVASVRGMSTYWQEPCMGKPGKAKFNITGQVLAARTQREVMLFLLVTFEEYGGRFTRFDDALDDYTKSLDFDAVAAAIDRGDVFGFRTFEEQRSGKVGATERGRAQYWGSKNSLMRACFYDKTVESKGEIDAHRLEVRFKDEYAELVGRGWLMLADRPDEEVQDYLMGMAVGGFEFREKRDKNRDRCPMLDWWADFLVLVKSAPRRVSLPKQKPCLVRTMEALENQYAPMLATIADVLGDTFEGWIEQLKEVGQERMGSRHRAIASLARDEYAAA